MSGGMNDHLFAPGQTAREKAREAVKQGGVRPYLPTPEELGPMHRTTPPTLDQDPAKRRISAHFEVRRVSAT